MIVAGRAVSYMDVALVEVWMCVIIEVATIVRDWTSEKIITVIEGVMAYNIFVMVESRL